MAEFALVAGISSKGRISEMEKGLVRPTVAQALTFERLGREHGIAIDAALLNADVAAARALPIDDQSDPGSWVDAIANSPNMRVEHHFNDLAFICAVCEKTVAGDISSFACAFSDCPHNLRAAA